MTMRRLILALLLACAPVISSATVTTSTRSATFTGAPTTNFTVPFHFQLASDLKVTLITIATEVEVIQTNGVAYSVTLPIGATSGIVSMSVAVTALEQLRIERLVPYTQTTSFKSQGRFTARSHEDAIDKNMMAIQQLAAGTTTTDDITTAINTHEAAADPHSGVYHAVAGVAGGQLATGGTAASENLTLRSTSHATKGKVILGSASVYDEVNDRLGIGTTTPTVSIETSGDVLFDDVSITSVASGVVIDSVANKGVKLTGGTAGSLDVNSAGLIRSTVSAGGFFDVTDDTGVGIFFAGPLYGVTSSDLGLVTVGVGTDGYLYGQSDTLGDLYLAGNSAATNGNIFFGTASTYDQANDYFGIGTLAPDLPLDIGGTTSTGSMKVGLIYGSHTAGGDLQFITTSDGTRGNIFFGSSSSSTYDETNDYWGIGTATPDVEMDVRGTVVGRRRIVPEATSLDAGDCGGVQELTSPAGKITISLPTLDATYEGCTYTFLNTRASGASEIAIDPAALDIIRGTCSTSAADHEFAMALGVAAKNTAAAQNLGDYITIVGMFAAGKTWYVTGCSGTWADGP